MPGDLPWCAAVLEDGFERVPHLKSQLPDLWSRLLQADAMAMTAIVDEETSKPVAFGAGSIVSDECVRAVRAGERPHMALQILTNEANGGSWILRPDEVRRVNHPGARVNLCLLHYSEVIGGRSFEDLRVVRDKAIAELLNALRGYAAKEFLYEVYGQHDLPFTRVMGVNLRTGYEDFYASGATAVPAPERRPYLLGLTIDEVAAAWGSPVGMLFGYLEPLIFFTAMQQRVLVRATSAPTPEDPELARQLNIGRSTLRDHWRAIFARVAEAQGDGRLPPRVLPHFSESSPALRSALLGYLQHHPEELRPVDRKLFAPRRQAHGR